MNIYLLKVAPNQILIIILVSVIVVKIIHFLLKKIFAPDGDVLKEKTFKNPRRFTSLKAEYLGVCQITPDKILVLELVVGTGKVLYDTTKEEYARFKEPFSSDCRPLRVMYKIGDEFWIVRPPHLKRFAPGDVLHLSHGSILVVDQTKDVVWDKKVPKK